MGISFSGSSGKHPLLAYLRLSYEHPAALNLNNGNGAALLGLLGLPCDNGYGECTMPEARRAIMQARARFARKAQEFTREGADEQIPGRARYVRGALTEDGLLRRLDMFEEFVNTMDRMGADRLTWG